MKFILVAFIGFIILPLALAERSPKIMGGRDAEPYEFPFMVALTHTANAKILCGGTILSNLFILTAAHCLYGKSLKDFVIKAGKQKISVKEKTEQIRHSAKIILHEEYVYRHINTPDIGLIKLGKPLHFTRAVKPIALPKKNEIPRGHGTIIGWGVTSYKRIWGRKYPEILQKAIVPILPNDVCAEAWKKKVNYTDRFLCTGPLSGKNGFCDGDSGGPLMQYKPDEMAVIGIANFAPKRCGTKERVSVFARVSAYIDWINKNMK